MSDPAGNNSAVAKFVEETLRIPVVGFCRSSDIIATADISISAAVGKLSHCIVLGHPLSKAVLDTIVDHPNLLYKNHYQQINWRLDRAATELALLIENMGALALPLPASSIVDWENQRGHLSHRDAAISAGIGWRGRHGLVVTPKFGAQIRFTSVLTDLPLIPGEPIAANCATCRACIAVCPASAISEDGCDVRKCFEKLKEFSKIQGVGQFICGVCIKACSGER